MKACSVCLGFLRSEVGRRCKVARRCHAGAAAYELESAGSFREGLPAPAFCEGCGLAHSHASPASPSGSIEADDRLRLSHDPGCKLAHSSPPSGSGSTGGLGDGPGRGIALYLAAACA